MKTWPSTIQVKLTLGFAAVSLALIAVLTIVLETRLRAPLQEESLKLAEASGAQLVSELSRRTQLANTLAQTIANLAAKTSDKPDVLQRIIPTIFDLSQEKSLIAGGGFWPEPFIVDPKRERNSFFWGRTEDGELRFFDDYNAPAGPGYHREEWYVPARGLQPGRCYWSRSYVDPYSKQPMVTCSTPVYNTTGFIGVATVDLRLEGLAQSVADASRATGGYAFVVDQNNQFITFPDRTLILEPSSLQHIRAEQLAQRDSRFRPLARALVNLNRELLTRADAEAPEKLAQAELLAQSSYQINRRQAQLIVTALTDPLGTEKNGEKRSELLRRVTLNDDLLLGEPVTAAIFHVPHAYWKVVVITPKSQYFAPVQQIITDTGLLLVIPVLLIVVGTYFMLQFTVLSPIRQITQRLKQGDGTPELAELDSDRNDVLGELTFWYNRRTRALAKAMNQLSELNRELKYHAEFDSLTHLTNRRKFHLQMDALIENGSWEEHALLYLDIDQFKVINDTCGHAAGDQLLVNISQQLMRLTRSDDVVARVGGDEFAMLVSSFDLEGVEGFAERIRQVIDDMRFSWDGKLFEVSCSIGVAHLADIEPDRTAALRLVDNACYEAKDQGRNRVQLYQIDNDRLAKREGEMNWLAEIQSARETKRFFPEFQIIGHTSGGPGALPALEALLRMRDPQGDVVLPRAFLPAAERYNAVYQIDKLMLSMVFETLGRHKQLLDQIEFCSINLSGDALCQEQLVPFVNQCLRIHRIPAGKICFEITENQMIANLERARKVLEQLRTMGFTIAMDDFGTGMSSYSYLRQLDRKSVV